METCARSHTRESLNKPDEPQNRTRRLSQMFRLLVLFDVFGETRLRLCRQGPGLTPPPHLSPLCKGVNSQPPVPLGLEHQAAGREFARFAPLRGRSARRQLGFRLDLARGVGCGVAPPGRTQASRPTVSSSCEILALRCSRIARSCKGAGDEYTRRRSAALAVQPPPPPCLKKKKISRL